MSPKDRSRGKHGGNSVSWNDGGNMTHIFHSLENIVQGSPRIGQSMIKGRPHEYVNEAVCCHSKRNILEILKCVKKSAFEVHQKLTFKKKKVLSISPFWPLSSQNEKPFFLRTFSYWNILLCSSYKNMLKILPLSMKSRTGIFKKI